MPKEYILPEIVGCGVYDSRFHFKNAEFSKPRNVSIFELELPLEETGVSYFDGAAYSVSLNNFIIAKPGHTRYTKLHYKCYYIHILVPQGETYDILSTLPDILPVSNREKYVKLFQNIIKTTETPTEENRLLLAAKLYELMYSLKKDTKANKLMLRKDKSYGEAIKMSLEYINENYASSLTLDMVASHVHLSKIYFHNLFKSAIGKTVHQYILDKRIEDAKRKLLATSDSAGSIAMSSGFSSQSYFNYIFRKETGLTPGQYKEKMSKSYIE